MKVTYNWLKEYLDFSLGAEALASKFTAIGHEVVGIKKEAKDTIFELEVTSNRPDCLSVVGLAREIAAATGKKMKSGYKLQVTSHKLGHEKVNFKIQIENNKDCPLYTASIIEGVKIGSSPEWIKNRLELIGCRSVNSIVDITNFILFDLGQPLHAFDLDKIVSQFPGLPVSQLEIIVRRAKNNEEIVTIDGIKRQLNEDILVIAAAIKQRTGQPVNRSTGKPIAIAGIMGGKDTEVTSDTRNILLEAAIFHPVLVRKSRQFLKLNSDSAYRFERQVDISGIDFSVRKAVALISEISGGKAVFMKKTPNTKIPAYSKSFSFALAGIEKKLNMKIGYSKAKNILEGLGFKVTSPLKGKISVKVPTFRNDIEGAHDIAEEFARILGYENIVVRLPRITAKPQEEKLVNFISRLKQLLSGLGLQEVITYTLTDRDSLSYVSKEEPVEILNPLSKEQEVLRTSIIPGLLRCVAVNLNQKQSKINIFEISKIFKFEEKTGCKETTILGIIACGGERVYTGKDTIEKAFDFYYLKGIAEVILARLGINGIRFIPQEEPGVFSIGTSGKKLGKIFPVSQKILLKFEIKYRQIWMLEFDLEEIYTQVSAIKKFTPLWLFPEITRDISIVVKNVISAQEMVRAAKLVEQGLLKEVFVSDFYRGDQIPADSKSLTISCVYRAHDRTLTEAEIHPVHERISAFLVEKFQGLLR